MMQVLDARGRWVPVRVASDSRVSVNILEDGNDALFGGSVELVSTVDGRRIFASYENVYHANPWLYACVQTLARGQSRLPLKVFRDLDDDSKERIRPGTGSRAATLARALARPGDGISRKGIWHATKVDRHVYGNGLWFVDRDRAGNYTGFRRIPWKHAAHERIAGVLRYWDRRVPDTKRLADDVIHFGAALDCNEILNPSPIESLRATVALYDAVERHLVAFFKNNARPSGHVEVQPGTKQPAVDLIRDEILKLYAGPENAGKVLVTSGKFNPITATPDNTKVIELAKQSREEICGAYSMPPPLVGILDRAIMSNVRELRAHLYLDVVGPHAELDEADIDAQVIARDSVLDRENVYVEFEYAARLKPDLEARARTWKDQRYLLTLNEMRALENRPPIDHPDADVPWMPLNEAPLGADNAPDDDDDQDDDERPPAPPREDPDAE